MISHKAPRFTPSSRGFSAACHGFGLSGSAGSRKPLKHASWLKSAVQTELSLKTVAVLFARSSSIYKLNPACDVFDLARDALTFKGNIPVIAHPPCRGWGRLRHLSKHLPGELELAFFAVDAVRRCGGVLEHPAHSMLWPAAGLPLPGERDKFGGFTLPILQSWFGHGAPKATWLYFVGLEPSQLPPMPFALGVPAGRIENMCVAERERTPLDLAKWLFQSCSVSTTATNSHKYHVTVTVRTQ